MIFPLRVGTSRREEGIFIYENGRMKPVKMVLRKGMRKNNRGGKSKIYSKHICKYQNGSPYKIIIC
jgi:hypothetical protein